MISAFWVVLFLFSVWFLRKSCGCFVFRELNERWGFEWIVWLVWCLEIGFLCCIVGLLIMVKFSSCFLRKCGKKVEILYIVIKIDILLKLRCWRFCLHGPIYLYIYLCNRKSFEILKKKITILKNKAHFLGGMWVWMFVIRVSISGVFLYKSCIYDKAIIALKFRI
jgi:hypothetical protein